MRVMASDVVLDLEPEHVQIVAWRFGELVRAGYDTDNAIDVAEHLEVDLHRATELVFRGCPPATAKRILL